MVFKVGTHDYSDHVVAGSYKINNEPQYSEWTDANYRKHKVKLRDKVVGSFDMFFRSITDYETFKSHIAAETSTNNSVGISVTVNNTSVQADINAFLKYDLTAIGNLKFI